MNLPLDDLVCHVLKTPNDQLVLSDEQKAYLESDKINIRLRYLAKWKLILKFNEFLTKCLNDFDELTGVDARYFYLALYSAKITDDDFEHLRCLWYSCPKVLMRIPINFLRENQPSINHTIIYMISDVKIADPNYSDIKFECNDLCLTAACKLANTYYINHCLINGIKATKEQFDIVIEINANNDDKKLIVMDFITHGDYIVSFEDYEMLIEKDIIIEPHKVNMAIDDKFYETCLKNKRSTKFRNYVISQFPIHKPTIKTLYASCEASDIEVVKLLIETYDIIPNELCMEFACKEKSCKPTVAYLMTKGIKPNVSCLLNMLKATNISSAKFLASVY
jgi:hypothetical protein